MNKCPNVNYFNVFSEHKCATKPKTKFMKKKKQKTTDRYREKKINEKRGKKRRNADRRQRRRTIEKHRMSGCRSN